MHITFIKVKLRTLSDSNMQKEGAYVLIATTDVTINRNLSGNPFSRAYGLKLSHKVDRSCLCLDKKCHLPLRIS